MLFRSRDLSKRWRLSGRGSVSKHASIHTYYQNPASNVWHEGTAKMLQQQYRSAEGQSTCRDEKNPSSRRSFVQRTEAQRYTAVHASKQRSHGTEPHTINQKNKTQAFNTNGQPLSSLIGMQRIFGDVYRIRSNAILIPEISGDGKECRDDLDETSYQI